MTNFRFRRDPPGPYDEYLNPLIWECEDGTWQFTIGLRYTTRLAAEEACIDMMDEVTPMLDEARRAGEG